MLWTRDSEITLSKAKIEKKVNSYHAFQKLGYLFSFILETIGTFLYIFRRVMYLEVLYHQQDKYIEQILKITMSTSDIIFCCPLCVRVLSACRLKFHQRITVSILIISFPFFSSVISEAMFWQFVKFVTFANTWRFYFCKWTVNSKFEIKIIMGFKTVYVTKNYVSTVTNSLLFLLTD